MKKLNEIFIKLLWITIPLPIFLDLTKQEIYISHFAFTDEMKFPMPIGTIGIALIFLIQFILIFMNSNKFDFLIKKSQFLLLNIFITVPIFLYSIVLSENTFPRTLQYTLGLVLLTFASIPSIEKERITLAKIVTFSAVTFFSLHFISLALQQTPLYQMTEFDFALIFNYVIYQSHVSYPGIISLYIILFFYLILTTKQSLFFKSFLLLGVFFSCQLLFIAARKASLIEMIIIFSSILLFHVIHKNLSSNYFKRKIIQTIIIIILTVSLYILVFEAPIYTRLAKTMLANGIESGRIAIYKNAIDVITKNTLNFLIGHGGGDTVGFHNFALDTIYRLGLIGVSILFLYVILLLKFIISKSKSLLNTEKKIYIFLTLACVAIQSSVNSALSQPLYVTNLLACLIIITYYPSKPIASISSNTLKINTNF